jgi:hypothetical protein
MLGNVNFMLRLTSRTLSLSIFNVMCAMSFLKVGAHIFLDSLILRPCASAPPQIHSNLKEYYLGNVAEHLLYLANTCPFGILILA